MCIRKILLAVSLISLVAAVVMPARPVGASLLHQCGNACGIPGCQICTFDSGSAGCTGWCADETPDSPADTPDDGGGGDDGGSTPGDSDGEDPAPPPPPPGGDGDGGGSGDGGDGGSGTDDGPSDDGTAESHCWSCVATTWCPSGYLNPYCEVWQAGQAWAQTWSCAVPGACDRPPSSDDGTPPDPPCIPNYNADGIDINGCVEDGMHGFEWEYALHVSARVPPHLVQVDPFPRWLVAMGAPLPSPFTSSRPGRLTLQDYPGHTPPGLCAPNGPGNADGCWSNSVAIPPTHLYAEPSPGFVRNYRIGLRWRRLDRTDGVDLGPYPPICWDFDERDWNVGADYGYGSIPASQCGSTSVTHVYETSSWGLPHNGPRYLPAEEACPAWEEHCCEQVPSDDGEWDMAAYQVRVYTTWAAEWQVRWESWEQVGMEWGDCGCTGLDPTADPNWRSCGEPPPGICIGTVDGTEWWGRWGEPEYGWVEQVEGWHPIDLRLHGSPTWYYTSYAVITTGAGPWCAYEYADPNPGDTVRVPVIEVQSVLRDPCVVDGTCPPGYR